MAVGQSDAEPREVGAGHGCWRKGAVEDARPASPLIVAGNRRQRSSAFGSYRRIRKPRSELEPSRLLQVTRARRAGRCSCPFPRGAVFAAHRTIRCLSTPIPLDVVAWACEFVPARSIRESQEADSVGTESSNGILARCLHVTAPRKSANAARRPPGVGLPPRGCETSGCCGRLDDLWFAAVRDFHFAGLGLFGDGERDREHATVVAGRDPIRIEAVA